MSTNSDGAKALDWTQEAFAGSKVMVSQRLKQAKVFEVTQFSSLEYDEDAEDNEGQAALQAMADKLCVKGKLTKNAGNREAAVVDAEETAKLILLGSCSTKPGSEGLDLLTQADGMSAYEMWNLFNDWHGGQNDAAAEHEEEKLALLKQRKGESCRMFINRFVAQHKLCIDKGSDMSIKKAQGKLIKVIKGYDHIKTAIRQEHDRLPKASANQGLPWVQLKQFYITAEKEKEELNSESESDSDKENVNTAQVTTKRKRSQSNGDDGGNKRLATIEKSVETLTVLVTSLAQNKQSQQNNYQRNRQQRDTRKCYNCGIQGHLSRDCNKPKREFNDRQGRS